MGVSDLTPLAKAVLSVEGTPERVLDVNCGEGDSTLFLAREYLSARVRGVDGSEEAVRSASSRIGLDPEGRIAFKVGRARELPFPDGNFDLVVQRTGRLRAAELARVLRNGGWLIGAEAPRFGGLPRHGFLMVEEDGELFVMRLEKGRRKGPRE